MKTLLQVAARWAADLMAAGKSEAAPAPAAPDLDELPLPDLRVRAEAGEAAAQYALGDRYEEDEATEAQALAWYRKAADQGHGLALTSLGMMYEDGRGTAEDAVEAATLYSQAADRGDPSGQYALAQLYEEGRGVAPNLVEAHRWCSLAASGFAPGRAGFRDVAADRRNALAARMTPAEIAEAERRAAAWRPR